MDASNNLLVRLRKWVHRQDENLQTEAFAHLLRHLLAHDPEAAVEQLRQLTDCFLALAPEECEAVSVTTQVTTDQGRPDLEIRTGRQLVYIEAKVEAGFGQGQLEGYRAELQKSKLPSWLVALTRYQADLPAGAADFFVRWHEVAGWIESLRLTHPASRFLADQFVGFLKERGMTIDRVGWELENGVRSLQSLMAMLGRAVENAGLRYHKVTYSQNDGTLGFYVDGQRYWVGVGLADAGTISFNTWQHKVDKEKADACGLGSGVFESYWPKETLGPYRWGRRLELDSEEVHFFSRTKEIQLQFLEKFLLEFVDAAKRVEGSSDC
jgi:hypothetical protein